MRRKINSGMYVKSIGSFIGKLSAVLLVLGTFEAPAEAQDIAAGKSLFESQCATCHAIDKKTIGPALKGINERRDQEWLIKWVKNSAEMIKAGDPIAVQLFNEYNKVAMNSFQHFSDEDVKNILAYIKDAETLVAATVPATGESTTAGTTAGGNSGNANSFYSANTMWILLTLAIILVLISLLLWRINAVLKKLVAAKHPEKYQEEAEPSWWDTQFLPWARSLNPTITTMVIVTLFVVASGGWFFKYANTEIGVQQNYAPTQPINFSHELHAGQKKIDCQYCHTTVTKGKQASIPDVSTCMNCHSYIDANEKYDGEVSPEIQKIRTAYETGEPIKWVRIHNLPDLAYFNHAQHVAVGKVECQACHGPIETMEKVSQHATLQMGWCINCHREAEVDVANNDYYEKLHADLKANGRVTTTVAGNGGLDCSKCHY